MKKKTWEKCHYIVSVSGILIFLCLVALQFREDTQWNIYLILSPLIVIALYFIIVIIAPARKGPN